MLDKQLFKEYVLLNNKLQELEEKKELLRDKIILELQNSKIEKAETDFGTFTRVRKISWEYTQKISALEEKVKIAKVKEQQSGKAKASESESLRFTKLKPTI